MRPFPCLLNSRSRIVPLFWTSQALWIHPLYLGPWPGKGKGIDWCTHHFKVAGGVPFQLGAVPHSSFLAWEKTAASRLQWWSLLTIQKSSNAIAHYGVNVIAEEQLARERSERWERERSVELQTSRFKAWLHHLTTSWPLSS